MLTNKHSVSLSLADENDHERICQIAHALSSMERIKILQFLQFKSRSLSKIASATNIPFSSVSRHIDILQAAGLVNISYQPSTKGHAKYCALNMLHFHTQFECSNSITNSPAFFLEMPVGMFSKCDISAPCGMLSKDGPINEFDDPFAFFNPERSNAECVWFQSGYISYNFPSNYIQQHNITELSFSFEICSEARYYNPDWPSDITIYVNDIELLTFTIPGDFGGRRGKYTPEYWPTTSTQYGILKRVTINQKGVYLDEALITPSITLSDLELRSNSHIQLTIAVKEDAEHCGGINLFGSNFGDYPQHIIMTCY